MIHIREHPNKNLLVLDTNNADLILSLMTYFQYIDKNNIKLQTNFITENFKVHIIKKDPEQGFILPAGFYNWLIFYLSKMQIEFTIDENLIKPKINLIDKWVNILREYQLKDVEKILKSPRGIGKLYTGYGKTELILSIIESYLENNVTSLKDTANYIQAVILVPTNSIKEEIIFRMKKWNVKKDFIEIINPVGFLKSNLAKDLDFKKRLLATKLLIIDEVHHVPANSVMKMVYKYLPNIEYCYGFSATPDPKDGTTPTILLPPYSMNPGVVKLVSVCGQVLVSRKASHKKFANIYLIDGEFSPTKVTLNEFKYSECLDATAKSDKFINFVKNVYKHDKKIYLPVHKIETGKYIYKKLKQLGVNVIYWDANTILPESIENLKSIKEYVNKSDKVVLITTSVSYEGVDFPSMDSVILYHGQNWRMTLQPVGRARSDKIDIYLIRDRNVPVIKRHTDEKVNILISEYEHILRRIEI